MAGWARRPILAGRRIMIALFTVLAILAGLMLVAASAKTGHHSRLTYLSVYLLGLSSSVLAGLVKSPGDSLWRELLLGGAVAAPICCWAWRGYWRSELKRR